LALDIGPRSRQDMTTNRPGDMDVDQGARTCARRRPVTKAEA
jgi:hypothetical protein